MIKLILNCLSNTKGKSILILRFIDTIFVKLSKDFYRYPHQDFTPKTCKAMNLSFTEIVNGMEPLIASKFLSHQYSTLENYWVSYSVVEDTVSYNEIDWHVDRKSGYRFNKRLRSSKILNNLPSGVDVKMPWELARLQHLPFLAKLGNAGTIASDKIAEEFKNEINDFISNNPMGYGINWACSMDVAIRAVNMLLAYDMLGGVDSFTDEFNEVFSIEIQNHGAYIYRNLEKNFTEDKSGNHYLSDLCGLVVIGAHLETKQSKRWFKFATDEFFSEVEKQIFDDGGNYEFSTAYQRLDDELIALTTAFLVFQEIEIPETIVRKISAMIEFTKAMMYSDGQIVQIGDNDSGHLFRISYNGSVDAGNPVIDELDGRPALNALNALFETKCDNPEAALIRSIMGNKTLKKVDVQPAAYSVIKSSNISFDYSKEETINLNLSDEIEKKIFPDFGLATLTGDNFKLFYRLPTKISKGKSLHIHNDFLHYEYEFNGEKFYRDRGSYTYTGNEKIRNLFRSDAFHNVPLHTMYQNSFTGVWGIHINSSVENMEVTDRGFSATIKIGDIIHRRTIEVSNDGALHISDESNEPFKKAYAYPKVFSGGYGIINNIAELTNGGAEVD